MTTHKFDLKYVKLCQQIEKMIINEFIAKKLDIVIDRTSLTKKSRKHTKNKILLAAKRANLPDPFLKLIIIETPLEVCINRNMETMKVPPDILNKMINSYEEPSCEEGWDEIIKLKF